VRIRNAGYLVSAVDGFTIQNGGVYTGGNYQQMYGPGGLGGGININVASPYIANNVIKRNSLAYDNTPGVQSLGGGIYAWVSYAEISGNTITENEVLNAGQGLGGGIYCCHSLPVIRDNRISQNRAKNGSAIYCDTSSPSIKNNTIENNSFYDIGMPPYSGAASGAINLWLGDSFLIEGNLIRGNLAGATGGQGAGILVSSNFAGRIQNNLIVNNSANGSGGGIYAIVPVAAMESLYIVNNTIVGNTGAYYAEAGGGLALFITAPITTLPESTFPRAGSSRRPWRTTMFIR
jgi:predicted outer membrane repeat protein